MISPLLREEKTWRNEKIQVQKKPESNYDEKSRKFIKIMNQATEKKNKIQIFQMLE